jgi:hypothetical protein
MSEQDTMTFVDDLAETYFQHELMNETRAYIERGRRLERFSDQDVLDAWVAAFEREDARNMEDAAAELRLRGIEEPHERVRPKIDVLKAEIERLAPDAQPEGLDQRIKDFLAALRGPKN